MKSKLKQQILDLWHISRTALATQDQGRHARMTYVKNELLKSHIDLLHGLTGKALWFEIEETISYYKTNT